MYKIKYNLAIFDGEGGDGSQGSAGNNGATYSYEQAEEIASARASRAEKAALANYFKQQGMSEEEITSAIADFKQKKKNSAPDVSAIEKERDTYKAQLVERDNSDYLLSKGVSRDDLEYVQFKVNKNVDDKTDFKKAADAYLKDNPRFAGGGYRATGATRGGNGKGKENVNATINESIRNAFKR